MKKLLIIPFSIVLITLPGLTINAVEPVKEEKTTNQKTTAVKPAPGTPPKNITAAPVKSPVKTATQTTAQSNVTNKSNIPAKNSGGITIQPNSAQDPSNFMYKNSTLSKVTTAMSNAGTAMKNAVTSVGQSISNAASSVASSAKSVAQKLTGSGSSQTTAAQKATAAKVADAQFQPMNNEIKITPLFP